MSEPRIDTSVAGRVYFVDATGARWRVYDCAFRAHRWERLALRDARATHRVFAPPDPNAMLRTYAIREPGDLRLDVETLTRQLGAAGYAERRPEARRGPAGPR